MTIRSDLHFGCTRCGQCCRNTRIPLSVAEAIQWLDRGGRVEILCEGSPWVPSMDLDPNASHFQRQSFAVTSGAMPARVAAMLVAHIEGNCPNLSPENECRIYPIRPAVCRIYPAEINPFIELRPADKSCPPEAWSASEPLLYWGGGVADDALQQEIMGARNAHAKDALVKERMCYALNLTHTALIHEAMLVFSPTRAELRAALSLALTADGPPARKDWTFVSNAARTLHQLGQNGAIASPPSALHMTAYAHIGFVREPIFNHPHDESVLRR